MLQPAMGCGEGVCYAVEAWTPLPARQRSPHRMNINELERLIQLALSPAETDCGRRAYASQ